MEYTPNFDGPVEDFTMEFEDVNNIGGGEGTEDFNSLYNRPKYNDQFMTGATNIPKVPTKTSDIANDSDFVNQSTVNNLIDIKTSTKADTSTVNELNTRIISAEGDLESLGGRVTTAESAVLTLNFRANSVDEDLADIRKDFDELSNKPNFVIMLNTYAELQNFDTELLKDTDTVGVLTDETHDNKTTFYNYRTFQNTWHYVGAIENDYTLPTASASEKGGVKVGSGLEISEDGTLSTTGGGGGEYTLPPATTDTLGGVKVGSGLTVTPEGLLSATGGGGGDGYQIKKITQADINIQGNLGYSTSNNDSVGLWLLEPGVYFCDLETNVLAIYDRPYVLVQSSNDNPNFRNRAILVMVSQSQLYPSHRTVNVIGQLMTTTHDANSEYFGLGLTTVNLNIINDAGYATVESRNGLVDTNSIVNSLDGSSLINNYKPLSARKGYELNEKIKALESRVAALEG